MLPLDFMIASRTRMNFSDRSKLATGAPRSDLHGHAALLAEGGRSERNMEACTNCPRPITSSALQLLALRRDGAPSDLSPLLALKRTWHAPDADALGH